MEENTQDIRQLAKLRLQEIHAQMYVLSEEARIINGFLTLRDQEEANTNSTEVQMEHFEE
ncbi:hypothetical protein [Paenibacillus sp. Y412MC10]|uniref:hypothetical protein n=1 Tax=Geobacillus sp. (strain Y412MC10) TaxID=481743 RepID=UPI000178810D|nr:hypothetical protein [Paenibacillus sp. Y412MC10]ACX67596.1 hypothetical protein GYMC10_5387 [Paenibacillus sp. Y412MC10]